jgi:hypothetical protein
VIIPSNGIQEVVRQQRLQKLGKLKKMLGCQIHELFIFSCSSSKRRDWMLTELLYTRVSQLIMLNYFI